MNLLFQEVNVTNNEKTFYSIRNYDILLIVQEGTNAYYLSDF